MKNRVFVLDSSAFISGVNPNDFQFAITTPSVIEELKDSDSLLRLEVFLEQNVLKIVEPNKNSINFVKSIIKDSSASSLLSETDVDILALAFMFSDGYNVTIVTDDYDIQNFSEAVNAKYLPIMTEGIKNILKWERYCPNCNREYNYDEDKVFCDVCGGRLKTRPKR